jgi:BioD-like phosphotransacetylase family protein
VERRGERRREEERRGEKRRLEERRTYLCVLRACMCCAHDAYSYRCGSLCIFSFFFSLRYQDQLDILHAAHKAVSENNDFTVIEGTGHTAVGSIVGLNNARVAAELGVPVVLVCNGGIGSSVDEIELNRQLCLAHGARVAGVILNKVQPAKLEMVRHYVSKALRPWHIPLIACIPDYEFLEDPCLNDYEELLGE